MRSADSLDYEEPMDDDFDASNYSTILLSTTKNEVIHMVSQLEEVNEECRFIGLYEGPRWTTILMPLITKPSY